MDAYAAPVAANRLRPSDRRVHDWYRFVLAFPPHLVRTYLERFGVARGQLVLDPFCGTGTTLVECRKRGIASAGVERNPIAALASAAKLNWSVDPRALVAHARAVATAAAAELAAGPGGPERQLRALPAPAAALLLKGSISPRPLHQVLVLRDALERHALAHVIVHEASNLRFGPEVGVGPPRADAAVVDAWMRKVRAIAADLRHLADRAAIPATVYRADARELARLLAPASVDAVITSPPYPNEKDYTRTTRLE